MAIGHHVRPEVAAIDMANCDSAAVAIDTPGFAGDVAFANQCAQVFGCCSSRRPSLHRLGAKPTVTVKQPDRRQGRFSARESFLGPGS
jgi:hypothetical protein